MRRRFREAVDETQTKSHVARSRWWGSVTVIVGLCWLTYLYACFSLPSVASLRDHPPDFTAFMRATDGVIEYAWVPLSEISRYLPRAVIAAEDDRFYQHPGYDWEAIRRAAKENWKRRSFKFGGSTITQQLAKNLYLSADKTPFRKIKELLIALKLERDLSKERILELYLNVVEWAHGVYGAEAAAQHYFGTHAKHLSPNQAAFLASILPNPNTLGQRGYRLTIRAQSILRRM